MSKTDRPNYRRADREDRSRRRNRQDRRIVVRGVRRDPPDLRKLSRAVIALAIAEMEAENTPVASPETADPDSARQDIAQSTDASGQVSEASEDGEVHP
ncbi:hypothetical protein [Mycobacteroides abscessus]|uniref:hypothetical protein n=1 Tax=Mycobacteroides abscessus TaxID=36809 RepID=UPI001F1D8FBE|nr:hypothetical protein [Mycobacteroides abscessus]